MNGGTGQCVDGVCAMPPPPATETKNSPGHVGIETMTEHRKQAPANAWKQA